MMIQSFYEISFSFSTWEFFPASLFLVGAYHDCLTTRILLINLESWNLLARFNELMSDLSRSC
jgi:hypothetical protein